MSRKLEDWITSYLKYTDNTEPRESYRTWTAISMVAAALRRKCYFTWGSETWFPNFYIILVGPPAARKGTALRSAIDMLTKVGIYLAANETSRQKLITKIIEQIDTVDTEERIGYMHSSINIISPEFSVFIYGSDDKMIPTLCDWFDCGNKWEYETLGRGDDHITNLWVNILGATTPRSMQTILPADAFGTGLISRTLFIYEDWKNWIPYPTLDETLELPLTLDLEQMCQMAGQFKIGDKEFFKTYEDWYRELDNRPRDGSVLEDSSQRLPTHLFKLCMISSASRGNDRVITMQDFDRANGWLTQMEKKSKYAFQGIGQYSLAGVQARVIRLLAQEKRVSRGDILKRFCTDISLDQLGEIIASLIAMEVCAIDVNTDVLTYIPEDQRGKLKPIQPIVERVLAKDSKHAKPSKNDSD